jgi:uncharacterized protein YndB with AHSA1/START domain
MPAKKKAKGSRKPAAKPAAKSKPKRRGSKSRPAARSAASQLRLTQPPTAKTGMLIRKPVADVFEAIVDPVITSQFWFTKGSGRLDSGKPVIWEWEMYDVSSKVVAKVIEPNQRILMQWDGYSGRTDVEWQFRPWKDNTTFISVTESGWTGSGDELAKYAANSTEGFTWTIAGLKAFLEYGIRLNLVGDRFPEGIEED